MSLGRMTEVFFEKNLAFQKMDFGFPCHLDTMFLLARLALWKIMLIFVRNCHYFQVSVKYHEKAYCDFVQKIF